MRMSAAGRAALVALALLVIGGAWGGMEIYDDVKTSQQRADLAESEAKSISANVVGVQRRGGGDDRRSVIHYRYVAGGQPQTGATQVRRQDRDRYAVGSDVRVSYLPTEPGVSWMDGYLPRRRPVWPAFAVPLACTIAALGIVFAIRRQSHLVTYGRPALALVTKVEKKSSDKGTYWRVHYEWTLLSGGKHQGRYNHGKKNPPAVGTWMPIVYDRDYPSRHSKYPLSMVAVSTQ